MKKVIRYHHVRQEELDTESDAEHVYGMFAISDYFFPLEQNGSWNYPRIQQMCLYHDIDEILTGDRIGYLKTDADRAKEYNAQQEVVKLLPYSIQTIANSCLAEYEKLETMEAKFVKAMDKMEPIFHLINENGKEIMRRNKTTLSQHKSIKDKYVSPFPYIKRFNEVLTEHMLANGYFAPEQ